jgi:hypothetical protein
MEGEVVRLIKKGPQWKPASQGGRVVKAYRKQPVTFMIEDDSFNISSKTPFVFYVGTDNLISVTADKVKSEDLEITISQGSIISNGDGNYIVRVNKTGRVILQLFNKKKKNKEIGSASFEVKKQS